MKKNLYQAKLKLPKFISIKYYLNNTFGINREFSKLIKNRFEKQAENELFPLHDKRTLIIINTIWQKYPNFYRQKLKYIINIFFLDMISTYRGWRHSRGLPTRGQRTWMNAWSSFRANMTLRHFKLKLMSKMFKHSEPTELGVLFFAEQINSMWKVQWDKEWKKARKTRLTQIRKGAAIRMDLKNMAEARITTDQKLAKMSKKQKQQIKKNTFSIGFDLGFTTKIAKELAKSSEAKRVFFPEEKKKKTVKKKIDLKAKIIKHNLKKKKKKSVWD